MGFTTMLYSTCLISLSTFYVCLLKVTSKFSVSCIMLLRQQSTMLCSKVYRDPDVHLTPLREYLYLLISFRSTMFPGKVLFQRRRTSLFLSFRFPATASGVMAS